MPPHFNFGMLKYYQNKPKIKGWGICIKCNKYRKLKKP